MKHISEEKLGEFIDNELSTAERMIVAEHLEECVECSRTVNSWRVIARDVFNEPKASERFVSRVMSKLEEPGETVDIEYFLSKNWAIPELAAQGFGVVFAIVLLFFSANDSANERINSGFCD